MFKDANDWEIGQKTKQGFYDDENYRVVEINTFKYEMRDEIAGLTHAILLLVDAINDKKIN